MKRLYKFTALSAAMCCLIGVLYGCTRDNEIIIPETSVNPSATNYSVAIGDEVTFNGQNMHLISKVAFDNQMIDITTEPSERSQTSLTVTVPDNFEVTQNITVSATYNSVHKLLLSDAFEIVVPMITVDVHSATIGDKITLTGRNMHLITKVSFGDQVVSFNPNPDRSHTSLVVTVPSTFDETKTVQLSITYTSSTVTVSDDFEIIVPPAPSYPYLFWENVELGCHGTEKAFFDVSSGRTLAPCDVAEHKEMVTFALDNTSSAPTARLLNPANIGTNLLNSQLCNGTALNLNDFAIWKDPSQTTPFRKVTDSELINKVTSGGITDLLQDIGDIQGSDIKTNTPAVTEGEIYYFYHKEKFGLIWVKQLNIATDRKLNTIVMNVYYEKSNE